MTSFALKLFAVVFMLVDHTGILLWKQELIGRDVYILMRTLGRFAFPTYAFLLAEGFRHVKQEPARLKRHLLLLFVLAVVSEPFFDLFENGKISHTASQSVMFTLLLGFAGLWLAESLRGRPLLRGSVLLLACVAGSMLGANYRFAGVLLILACSVYLERFEAWGYGKRLLGMLAVMGLYYLVYCWSNTGFGSPAALWAQLRAMGVYGIPHLLLIPLLAGYRGALGYRRPLLHRMYQWFYPAHLAVLCLISALL